MKVWWAGSNSRADGMAWDIHLCVYSCLMPSSFIMNGLGLRFYFLAEKLGYRLVPLDLFMQTASPKILHSDTACVHGVCKDKRIMSSLNPLQGLILQVCIS